MRSKLTGTDAVTKHYPPSSFSLLDCSSILLQLRQLGATQWATLPPSSSVLRRDAYDQRINHTRLLQAQVQIPRRIRRPSNALLHTRSTICEQGEETGRTSLRCSIYEADHPQIRLDSKVAGKPNKKERRGNWKKNELQEKRSVSVVCARSMLMEATWSRRESIQELKTTIKGLYGS